MTTASTWSATPSASTASEKTSRASLPHGTGTLSEPRILIFDIETAPNLAYVWKLFDENVGLSQLVASTEVLSFAAKWKSKRPVQFKSQFHDGRLEMVTSMHELLDEADMVVHYNGKRFDVPHMNREFLEHGLKPPAPYKQIDLYQTVRSRFRFPSNKLEYVATQLGIGSKVKHEGFDLWTKCLAGDEAAWDRMRKYNKQDVVLTEKLYEHLLPWIASHPSFAAITGERVCASCGSHRLEKRGYAHTSVGTYQRYQCQACGRWMRDSKRIEATTVREVPL